MLLNNATLPEQLKIKCETQSYVGNEMQSSGQALFTGRDFCGARTNGDGRLLPGSAESIAEYCLPGFGWCLKDADWI